jgi:hypothetical protein
LDITPTYAINRGAAIHRNGDGFVVVRGIGTNTVLVLMLGNGGEAAFTNLK